MGIVEGLKDKQRLLSKIYINENNCWIWKAGKTEKSYGQFWFRGKQFRAHRAAYIMFKGEVGKLNVLHMCDEPRCCNPEHLFLGTQKDNILGCVKKE